MMVSIFEQSQIVSDLIYPKIVEELGLFVPTEKVILVASTSKPRLVVRTAFFAQKSIQEHLRQVTDSTYSMRGV